MNFNTNHHTNDSVAPKKKTTMLALAGLQIGHSDVDTHYGVDMEETLPSFQGLTMEDTLSFLKSPSVATAVLPPAIAIGVFLIAYNVISRLKDKKMKRETGAEVLTNNSPPAEVSAEFSSEKVQTVPVPVPVITVTAPDTVTTVTTVPVTDTNTNETETPSEILTETPNKTETPEAETSSEKTPPKTSDEIVESSKGWSDNQLVAAMAVGSAILLGGSIFFGRDDATAGDQKPTPLPVNFPENEAAQAGDQVGNNTKSEVTLIPEAQVGNQEVDINKTQIKKETETKIVEVVYPIYTTNSTYSQKNNQGDTKEVFILGEKNQSAIIPPRSSNATA
eukprot:66014_1